MVDDPSTFIEAWLTKGEKNRNSFLLSALFRIFETKIPDRIEILRPGRISFVDKKGSTY